MNTANHQEPGLVFDSSPHASVSGFVRPDARQRTAACKIDSKSTTGSRHEASDQPSTTFMTKFPAPLVLPDDELAWDPEYPPQSMQEWFEEEERNEVEKNRSVIYIAAPTDGPSPGPNITQGRESQVEIDLPSVKDLEGYLAAFYHPLKFKVVPKQTFRFTEWENTSITSARKRNGKSRQSYIGLETDKERIRIRARPSRDRLFNTQLNLNDVLDGAISILPDDAYALIVLVHHDIYEDEDDDFACGRAYGGSRVAVVSTARYNPNLDEMQHVSRRFAWPLSHTTDCLHEYCAASLKQGGRTKKATKGAAIKAQRPLRAAVSACWELPSLASSEEAVAGLWLGRVCQTASHELGHCFGVDHCSYFACVMQGTASVNEDVRQPPYLCPIDLCKVLAAVGSTRKKHYEALLRYCQDRPRVQLFAAFAAWLQEMLHEK